MSDYRKIDAERARATACAKNVTTRESGAVHFTPRDGYCPYCDADLVLYYGTSRWAGGLSITGCPKCHRSYCG